MFLSSLSLPLDPPSTVMYVYTHLSFFPEVGYCRLPHYNGCLGFPLQVKVDYIGAYRVREWFGRSLRHVGWWGYFTLLLSLLSYVMALMCCKSLHFTCPLISHRQVFREGALLKVALPPQMGYDQFKITYTKTQDSLNTRLPPPQF